MAKLSLEYTDTSPGAENQRVLVEINGDGDKEHIEMACNALLTAMGFLKTRVSIVTNKE